MSSEQSPNQGWSPPRHSTSIDEVMSQQQSGPQTAPSFPDAVPGTPGTPATPGTTATRTATSATGGAWKTAAEASGKSSRKRSFSIDAQFWFGLGLALMLWGGILLVDHFGPTKDVAAHITDVDVTHSRKGGTTYSIEGIDNHGGEFDTDVTESIYDRADRGDSVVVSRAWLTGRVVAIDGGGWRHDGGRMVWLYGIAFVVGLVLLICGLVSMFRFAAAAEGNPRPLRRVRWWLIAVLVVAAGWIVYERNEANAGSGGTSSSDGASSDTASSESGTDNTLAPTATLLFGPGSVQCSTLIGVVPLMVSTLTIDDVVTPTEIDEALATMSSVTSDCASDSIQEALCAELQRAMAADSALNVTTSGRCPGLP